MRGGGGVGSCGGVDPDLPPPGELECQGKQPSVTSLAIGTLASRVFVTMNEWPQTLLITLFVLRFECPLYLLLLFR